MIKKIFITVFVFFLFVFSCFSQEENNQIRKYYSLLVSNPYYSLITFSRVDTTTTLIINISSEIKSHGYKDSLSTQSREYWHHYGDRTFDDGSNISTIETDTYIVKDTLGINSYKDRSLVITGGSETHEICYTPSTSSNSGFVNLCFKAQVPGTLWGSVVIITVEVSGGVYGQDYWFLNDNPDKAVIAPVGGGSSDCYNEKAIKFRDIKK